MQAVTLGVLVKKFWLKNDPYFVEWLNIMPAYNRQHDFNIFFEIHIWIWIIFSAV